MIAALALNPALDVSTATERVRPTDKLRCDPPAIDPGGGGINVARVIHRLGGAAAALFPAGGATGALLIQMLAGEGIAAESVPFDALTRISFAVTDRQSADQYRFVLPGPTVPAATLEALAALLARRLQVARLLVVSGSLPPGLPASYLRDLGRIAARAHVRIVLDTSAALTEVGRALGAWALKPSLAELEAEAGEPLPDPASITGAARALIEDGAAQLVFVSEGAAGATLVTRYETVKIEAPRVEPVSAIGAGDSLVAGLTLALERGWAPVDALRFGVAAGSAALLTPGTQLARRADVERLHAAMSAAPVHAA